MSIDYKFGNKNNWRRTVWNLIRERVKAHPRDAVVLYLAGERDLDREAAKRHGFRDLNMIAVENDETTLDVLRERGTLAISGDIAEVVSGWPIDFSVDVLLVDLCCGLNPKIVTPIVEHFYRNPAFFTSVMVLNLLRGRDRNGLPYVHQATAANQRAGVAEKHRGYAALRTFWPSFTDGDCPAVQQTMKPKLLSYRSAANQTFDTMVVTHPFSQVERGWKPPSCRDPWKGAAIRRKIAAILAHRTMRLAA